MVVALLVVIIAILLFGAAAVRGLLTNIVTWCIAAVALLLVIGFAKSHYDGWTADRQRVADNATAKRLTLVSAASRIHKSQGSLLDAVAYDTDDDFEMCGTIAGTAGFGGNDGRQRWISNGGGRFEFEALGDRKNFDERVSLLCTYDHVAATMRE